MEYEIKCGCGRTHRAKCGKIIIEKGIIADIADYAGDYLGAGKVALMYYDGDDSVADAAEKSFRSAGYDTYKLRIPRAADDYTLYTSQLSEDTRLVIAIGAEEAAKTAKALNRAFILLLTTPSTYKVIEYSPLCVIADLDILHAADCGAFAAGYGELYAKLVACCDYGFVQAYSKEVECGELIDKIRCELETFFSVKYRRGSMEFTETLTRTLMSVGLYLSMLDDPYSLDCYRHYADLIAANVNGGRYTGEYLMIAAYYLQTLYRIALSKDGFGLCYPPDKIESAETLLRLCSKDLGSTLSEVKIADAKSVSMRGYVLGVHRESLLESFTDAENLFIRAGQNFRMMYDDAGFAIAREIKLDNLARIMSAGSILAPKYTLAKHYKETGVI